MMTEELKVLITANTNAFNAGMSSVEARVKSAKKSIGGDWSGLIGAGDSAAGALAGLSGLAKAAGAAGAAFAAVRIAAPFAKECISLSSDLQEVQNVVDVTFGSMAQDINSFAQNAKEQLGLSELAAKQYASTMGAMLKSSGISGNQMKEMSKNITALSADMASFYNLDAETAFEKIRSGISGETEPLKQLGINMSVANLEAYALAQGITKSYSAMSQAEQTLLRYNYLLSVTGDAQGDFARTSDSWANQTKILTENWKEFKALLGDALIPVLTKLVKALNTVLEVLIKIGRAVKSAVNSIKSVFGIGSDMDSSGQAVEDLSQSTQGAVQGTEDIASGAQDAAGGLEDAKKAAQELQNVIGGFDELHIIAPESTDAIDNFGGIDNAASGTIAPGGGDNPFKDAIDDTNKSLGIFLDYLDDVPYKLDPVKEFAPEFAKEFSKAFEAAKKAAKSFEEVLKKLVFPSLSPFTFPELQGIPEFQRAINDAYEWAKEKLGDFEGLPFKMPSLEGIPAIDELLRDLLNLGRSTLGDFENLSFKMPTLEGIPVIDGLLRDLLTLGRGLLGGFQSLPFQMPALEGIPAIDYDLQSLLQKGVVFASAFSGLQLEMPSLTGADAIISVLESILSAAFGAATGLSSMSFTIPPLGGAEAAISVLEAVLSAAFGAASGLSSTSFTIPPLGGADEATSVLKTVLSAAFGVATGLSTMSFIIPPLGGADAAKSALEAIIQKIHDFKPIEINADTSSAEQTVQNFFQSCPLTQGSGIDLLIRAKTEGIDEVEQQAINIDQYIKKFGIPVSLAITATGASGVIAALGGITAGISSVGTAAAGLAGCFAPMNEISQITDNAGAELASLSQTSEQAGQSIRYSFSNAINDAVQSTSDMANTASQNLSKIDTGNAEKNITDTFSGMSQQVSRITRTMSGDAISNLSDINANGADENVSGTFSKMREAVKQIVSGISGDANESLSSISGNDAVSNIQGPFSGLADWFSSLFNNIKQMWNDLKSSFSNFSFNMNASVSSSGSGGSDTSGAQARLSSVGDIEELTPVTSMSVPELAGGGVLKSGQLFIANERAPELVGNIGGRTGVMNNDQIVEAVSAGVASAVAQTLGGAAQQELTATVSGDDLELVLKRAGRKRSAGISGNFAFGGR